MKSIYEEILEGLEKGDGKLGEEFVLECAKDELKFFDDDEEGIDIVAEGDDAEDSEEDVIGMRPTWAPGARDGVKLYHMGIPEEKLSAEEAICIGNALQGLMWGSESKVTEAMKDLQKEEGGFGNPMVSFVGEVNEAVSDLLIERNSVEFAEKLWLNALEIMTTTQCIESVKFALVVTQTLAASTSESVKFGDDYALDIINKLSNYEEFTLFCLYNYLSWPGIDHEKALLDAAKRASGWGKIHAISALNAQPKLNEETREWIFRNGIHNDIDASYSAEPVFLISNMYERLQNDVTVEDYECMVEIIGSLFTEPQYAIDEVERPDMDKYDLTEQFIELTDKFHKTPKVIEALNIIKDYYYDMSEAASYMASECAERIKEAEKRNE